jgi:hypothetical protein
MAVQKEEVVLDFKVEQGDVVSELEKLKRVILANKQEQIELNKAFKAGQITQGEYVKETVRVENSLKRQQKQYNDTQKAVLGHKSKIDELIKSNDKLTKSNEGLNKKFSDFAGNLNIAGTNVGGLTSKLSSFKNPAIAAAGIVSGLSALYAKSAVGARDLAGAQESVGAGLDILANKLGNLADIGEDGFFTKISKGLTLFAGDVTGGAQGVANAQNAFQAQRGLRSLSETAIDAARIRKQTEKEAEDARRVRDDQEKQLIDRLNAANTVEEKLKKNESERVAILKTQVEETLKYGVSVGTINRSVIQQYRETRDVLNDIDFLGIKDQATRESIKKAQAEIADIQEEINGKLTENLKTRKEIQSLVESEAAIARINAAVSPAEQARILQQRSQVRAGVAAGDSANVIAGSVGSRQADLQKTLADARVNLTQDAIDRQIESERFYTDFIVAENQARLNATAGFFGALSGIFKQGSEEQKGLALFQIAIDSAVGVSGAIKAGAGIPFPGNLAAILTGVTTVLSGIAQARQLLGFQTGGYTGDGNPHDVAGVVHKKEVVWNAQDVSMMGGPSVVNAMRPTARYRHSRGGGYYDGGIVAKSASNEVNQQLAMINAIKSMPPPVVSAVEMTKAQNRVIVKQNISKR